MYILPELWPRIVKHLDNNETIESIYLVDELRPLICGDVWIDYARDYNVSHLSYSIKGPFLPVSPVTLVGKSNPSTGLSSTTLVDSNVQVDTNGNLTGHVQNVELTPLRPRARMSDIVGIHVTSGNYIRSLKDFAAHFSITEELRLYMKNYPIIVVHIPVHMLFSRETKGIIGYILRYFPNKFLRFSVEGVVSRFHLPSFLSEPIEKKVLTGYDIPGLKYVNTDSFNIYSFADSIITTINDGYICIDYKERFIFNFPDVLEMTQDISHLRFVKFSQIKINVPVLEKLEIDFCQGSIGRDVDTCFESYNAPNLKVIKIEAKFESIRIFTEYNLNVLKLLEKFPKLEELMIDGYRLNIIDIEKIESSQLKRLEIKNYKKDISLSSAMTRSLRSISLINLPELKSVSFLDDCKYLEVMEILDCNQVDTMQGFNLPNLRKFSLTAFSIEAPITIIGLFLPKLEHLVLALRSNGLISLRIHAPVLYSLVYNCRSVTNYADIRGPRAQLDEEFKCTNLQILKYSLTSIKELMDLFENSIVKKQVTQLIIQDPCNVVAFQKSFALALRSVAAKVNSSRNMSIKVVCKKNAVGEVKNGTP